MPPRKRLGLSEIMDGKQSALPAEPPAPPANPPTEVAAAPEGAQKDPIFGRGAKGRENYALRNAARKKLKDEVVSQHGNMLPAARDAILLERFEEAGLLTPTQKKTLATMRNSSFAPVAPAAPAMHQTSSTDVEALKSQIEELKQTIKELAAATPKGQKAPELAELKTELAEMRKEQKDLTAAASTLVAYEAAKGSAKLKKRQSAEKEAAAASLLARPASALQPHCGAMNAFEFNQAPSRRWDGGQ